MTTDRTIRILYYGSCWPTNIGNAFVNLGAINTIRRACGERVEIHHFGGMSSYLFNVQGQDRNTLTIAEWTRFDYVVIGGMTQCVDNFEAAERNLKGFLEKGAKLIIAGGGGWLYDDNEIRAVRDWMKRQPIAIFISRDRHSYENYGDLAGHSHDGIDSAFFISEGFTPIPMEDRNFLVINFDKFPEPDVLNSPPRDMVASTPAANRPDPGLLRRIKRNLTGTAKPAAPMPTPTPVDARGRRVIRTHHSPMWTKDDQFLMPNTLISDLPSDYLSLYAQASEVHSDRVHACIATLSFGNPARYYVEGEPRLRMFDRLGVGEIIRGLVRLEPERLRREKDAQVQFLSKALLDGEA
jgi:hypothetical protein